uniref:RAB11 family interacting protein 5 n=1 Tax=Anser cygnoides TaxID=8845 RepID=A0A8B9EJ89_ANSCY
MWAWPMGERPAPCWLPTHVQVTAVRARGLTGPGGSAPAAGPGDVYAVLELGRQRQRTAVAERSGGSAEWRDGCALELPPGPGSPPVLTVTVLQRALLGADRFLGRCSLALRLSFSFLRVSRWHKLHSKAGKKEKERGEVEVSVQFTRTNLTASMFDLSVKDKPRSPFGKLKDKVKGKKKYDLESASAIIPSSVGALDGEDDFDVGGKKSKIKGFLKGKLRKSSLTQSNTSLGSDSTISSASLGPAASAAEVTKSPSRHRLTPSSRLDSGQPEAFWTAVEEQEAAGCPQRLARGHSPPRPEPAWGHGAGRRGQAQGRPSAGEPEGPRRRCSADGKIDFKKADFWKPEAEERSERDASVPGNPFVPAVSPIAPSNPFAEKPPDSLPDPAVLDQSAKYYHLTHDELIQLLLQKEKELSKKEEHIQELENYIDQLLVRIMEQSPTLLQIPLGEAKTK